MSYSIIMQTSFEREKNLKATYITAGIIALLLLITFLYSWKLPSPPPLVFEEGMEVNLGNSDFGSGDIQPLLPGPPASSQDETSTPASQQASADDNQDVLKDENDADAPPIIKKEDKKPVVKPDPVKNDIKKPVSNKPVSNPTPAPPKPKAVYQGGTANNAGGNNSDDYNNSRNQGIAGGKGDQGKTNGNPNSDSYNGNSASGNGGPKILSGDRGITNVKNYIFQDELPPAKINVQLKISPDGRGTYLGLAKGSTSTDRRYETAIKGYLPKIDFTKADHESVVVVQFIFKVN